MYCRNVFSTFYYVDLCNVEQVSRYSSRVITSNYNGYQSVVCMSKNGKDTKHNSHISRRVHFVINGYKCKMHKINWCEGGLQSAYISAKNVGENKIYHGKY